MALELKDEHIYPMTLLAETVHSRIGLCSHKELLFDPKNARIQFLLRGNDNPTQNELFDILKELEHIERLCNQIAHNGGNKEPIIVQNNIVYEGNSRLTAYRILSPKDVEKWKYIRCIVLPDDFPAKQIDLLLIDYHVKGKKAWDPYEQAGRLYTCIHERGMSVQELSQECLISTRTINRLVKTYQLMTDVNDQDIKSWSYYEQLLKVRNIEESMDTHPKLKAIIIEKIKTKEIPKAADIRDKLPILLKANYQTIDSFINGKRSFEQSFIAAEQLVNSDKTPLKLRQFKEYINNTALTNNFKSPASIFELELIIKRIERLLGTNDKVNSLIN